MARVKKRENTRRVLVTLTEEAIERGKLLAVKDKTSFSEYLEELILKAKPKEEVVINNPDLANLLTEKPVGRLPRVEPKRSFKKGATETNEKEE